MPKHDATEDVLTDYSLPAEMTDTGEIINGTVHIHAVMAVEGDHAVEERHRLPWRRRLLPLVAVGAAHLIGRLSPRRIRRLLTWCAHHARPATYAQIHPLITVAPTHALLTSRPTRSVD